MKPNYRIIFSIVIFLLVFIPYYLTISRYTMEIDAGELILAQYCWGIAHPTGYPLYCLLGHLFLKIPLSDKIAFQANLLSAIYCALSVSVFFNFFLSTLNYRKTLLHNNETNRNLKESRVFLSDENIIAFLLSLTFGFLDLVWSLAVSTEVYSLQIFLVSLALFYGFKAYLNFDPYKELLLWSLFSVMLGLSFANHTTMVFLIIPFLLLFFSKSSSGFKVKIFHFIICFLTVLLVASFFYLIMFLRAKANPLLNWGDPSTFSRLIEHISGKQYGFLLKIKFDFNKFLDFLFFLKDEVGWILLILSVYGASSLFKKDKIIFAFFILIIIQNILFGVFYDIKDIKLYFFYALMSILFFLGYGLSDLFNKIGGKLKYLAFLIPIFFAIESYKNNDLSNFDIFENLTKDYLDEITEGIIFLDFKDWSYFESVALYLQHVEGCAPKAKAVTLYYFQLEWGPKFYQNLYPDLFKDVNGDIDFLIKQIIDYKNQKIDKKTFLKGQIDFIKKFINENLRKGKKIYFSYNFVKENYDDLMLIIDDKYEIVPQKFCYLLIEKGSYDDKSVSWFDIDKLDKFAEGNKDRHSIVKAVKTMLIEIMKERENYELKFERHDKAAQINNLLRSYSRS